MGTLAFERGALTLGQQLAFANEWREIVGRARDLGNASDPVLRQKLADAWIGLEIMRFNALRGLTAMARGEVTRETSISKLFWASLHRGIGELGLAALGPWAEIADGPGYDLSPLQRLFLYSRADTIYGGSNQIQRNIIGERVLGLPPEPKVV
jgi:alkylation response protein AidB-like acyl-CoA dehydrogenase